MPDITNVQCGHATTFVTDAFSGQITSITPGALTREVIPTTFLGSSNAHAKIPGCLYMAEPWTLDFQWVAGLNEIDMSTTAASVTVTFPLLGGDLSAGATATGQGFFSSFQPGEITTDGLMTATATWEWSSVVTWTSATS